MVLTPHGQIPAKRLTELAAFILDHRTTARLTNDAFASGLDISDIVQLDEYSLEIVVPLPDGLVLTYGTT